MPHTLSISIVTPSYNQGEFIERTINSVLSQMIPSMEYIIVDGASSDNTLEVIKKYSNQLILISEADQGQAHAVNKGLNMSKFDIIGWLNSDDIYYAGTIDKVIEIFETNPEVDVIYGKADFIDRNNKFMGICPVEPWNLQRLKTMCYLAQPAVFFRRSVVEKHGGLDENLNYCMDYEYWLRLGLSGAKFKFIDTRLAASRLYLGTKTVGEHSKVQEEVLHMLGRYFSKIPDKWFISYAAAFANDEKNLRAPKLSFFMYVYYKALLVAVKQNGITSGFFLSLKLPWIVFDALGMKRLKNYLLAKNPLQLVKK